MTVRHVVREVVGALALCVLCSSVVSAQAAKFYLDSAVNAMGGIEALLAIQSQRIVAHAPSGDMEIWFANKKTYELNSEMDGRPTKVVCDIDKEPSADGLYWGTCVEDK